MAMPIRLVICDDTADLRRMLSIVIGLESDIVVVGEASNGREAIEMAGSLQPDVMLLDVSMPVMDGIEALPSIREVSPGTAIVMLTGFASDKVRAEATSAGANGFVEKGSDVAVVVRSVRSAMAAVPT